MQQNIINELEEIEQLAIDAYSLISVIQNACEIQDYIHEEITLKYAKQIQEDVIEKISNLSLGL